MRLQSLQQRLARQRAMQDQWLWTRPWAQVLSGMVRWLLKVQLVELLPVARPSRRIVREVSSTSRGKDGHVALNIVNTTTWIPRASSSPDPKMCGRCQSAVRYIFPQFRPICDICEPSEAMLSGYERHGMVSIFAEVWGRNAGCASWLVSPKSDRSRPPEPLIFLFFFGAHTSAFHLPSLLIISWDHNTPTQIRSPS